VVNFGGFFAKLGHFAGFSLYSINNAVRIIEAEMGGLGDIVLNETKKVRTYGCSGIYINFDTK
jgi:hypothetical protein